MKVTKTTSFLVALALGSAYIGVAAPAQTATEDDVSVVGYGVPRASHARPGTETRTVVVTYADLDLSANAGIATLYRRIEVAAGKVCSPQEDWRNLALAGEWKQCYSGAMDDAVTQVDDARVAQLHHDRTGRSVDTKRELAGTH